MKLLLALAAATAVLDVSVSRPVYGTTFIPTSGFIPQPWTLQQGNNGRSASMPNVSGYRERLGQSFSSLANWRPSRNDLPLALHRYLDPVEDNSGPAPQGARFRRNEARSRGRLEKMRERARKRAEERVGRLRDPLSSRTSYRDSLNDLLAELYPSGSRPISPSTSGYSAYLGHDGYNGYNGHNGHDSPDYSSLETVPASDHVFSNSGYGSQPSHDSYGSPDGYESSTYSSRETLPASEVAHGSPHSPRSSGSYWSYGSPGSPTALLSQHALDSLLSEGSALRERAQSLHRDTYETVTTGDYDSSDYSSLETVRASAHGFSNSGYREQPGYDRHSSSESSHGYVSPSYSSGETLPASEVGYSSPHSSPSSGSYGSHRSSGSPIAVLSENEVGTLLNRGRAQRERAQYSHRRTYEPVTTGGGRYLQTHL